MVDEAAQFPLMIDAMEQFKIQNFADNITESFPPFAALSPLECGNIRRQFRDALGLPSDSNPLVIVSELVKRQSICHDTDAADEGFDLRELFCAIGINPHKDVFVNWYRFDDIDRLQFADLSKYFSDIWYPVSDDIEVFDDSLVWVVSIRHDGCISCLKIS